MFKEDLGESAGSRERGAAGKSDAKRADQAPRMVILRPASAGSKITPRLARSIKSKRIPVDPVEFSRRAAAGASSNHPTRLLALLRRSRIQGSSLALDKVHIRPWLCALLLRSLDRRDLDGFPYTQHLRATIGPAFIPPASHSPPALGQTGASLKLGRNPR